MKKHFPQKQQKKKSDNVCSMNDFDRFIPSKQTFSERELAWQGHQDSSSESPSLRKDSLHPSRTISENNSGPFLLGSLLREGIFSGESLSLNDPFSGRRLYSQDMLPSFEKCRKIPKEPFKVLDAPYLQDDFYLNVVDWSARNMLGVGLGNAVYTWDFLSNNVDKLLDLDDQNLVTSLTWSNCGQFLSVGTLEGVVSLWDINTGTPLSFIDFRPNSPTVFTTHIKQGMDI
jgi:cell division cycle 20-like protein 1 (cofactor of APC complex)